MADYFSPTVVQPTIPNADMTPLERLLLMQIFESEPDGDGLYFFAEIMPAEQIELPIETLRNALAASDGVASETASFVLDHINNIGEGGSDVEFDLSVTSWEFIFQDIVKRSAAVDHVSVVSAFTCTRMRPDGFGGMAILITADAIRGKSTEDILEPIELVQGHGARAAVRRIEPSPSFINQFGKPADTVITPDHCLGRILPIGRKMTRPTTLSLTDRNGAPHECVAEAFDTTHNVIILLYPVKALGKPTIILPPGFKKVV